MTSMISAKSFPNPQIFKSPNLPNSYRMSSTVPLIRSVFPSLWTVMM